MKINRFIYQFSLSVLSSRLRIFMMFNEIIFLHTSIKRRKQETLRHLDRLCIACGHRHDQIRCLYQCNAHLHVQKTELESKLTFRSYIGTTSRSYSNIRLLNLPCHARLFVWLRNTIWENLVSFLPLFLSLSLFGIKEYDTII